MKKIIALLLALVLICASLAPCSASPSVEGARINEEGELIVVFDDGSEKNLGRVVGDMERMARTALTERTVLTENPRSST